MAAWVDLCTLCLVGTGRNFPFYINMGVFPRYPFRLCLKGDQDERHHDQLKGDQEEKRFMLSDRKQIHPAEARARSLKEATAALRSSV